MTREEIIKRLANGVDVPPDILGWEAGINHWTWSQRRHRPMNLRDHNQPCGHSDAENVAGGWECDVAGCPGGYAPTRQELIDMLRIDYEAALEAWQDGLPHHDARSIVDAALGLTDS